MNGNLAADLRTLSEWARDQRRDLVHARPVIIVAPVLAATTRLLPGLQDDGAGPILVVTWGDGTGELPAEGSVTVVRAGSLEARDVVDELQAWSALLTEPPARVRTAVEAHDPERSAIVLLSVPAPAASFCGRPTVGNRSAEQEKLEDKTLSRQIWSGAGIAHAPEEVVDVDRKALCDSAARLDHGAGTVWSADASRGVNGGAARVRWVRDVTDAAQVDAAMVVLDGSDRARVMPFLEGVTCSIHGIVTDDGVIVLRPVELVMLRPVGSGTFRQAGISSWWDPSVAERNEMRAAARHVGDYLSREHGYRGAFGIDGILTADGFRPHELNPRFSGGLSTLGRGMPEVPLVDLDRQARLGGGLPLPVQRVEAALVAAADEARLGSAYLATSTIRPTETQTVCVTGSADELTLQQDGETSVGVLELGPASQGALVRFTPLALAPGERLAPWALAAYRLADRLWDTGFGAMHAPA
ncbi:hypothetical protein G9U51_00765 [Calidifontibacter sp. DB0510]|uniref:ATP-grasp domain-containing protein n=1 Tax=Metallococcus carri TaxID=1656884 RepID=A0A967ED29_9MICO|nr:hypothetical protein [Metallococcus carri]NHN54316.1 hypothetical protein [Metallococcus carri]NOP36844.1 hypothetical protein [Calidifontibacter sp. DB2511S]